MVKFFLLTENLDKCAGNGPVVNVAVFQWETDAQHVRDYLNGKGPNFFNVETIAFYNNTYEFFEERNNTIRNRALAKLTDEECEVLGLPLD